MNTEKLLIHPLKPGSNVFYGHAILDQIGLELPLVDLLVRETIQNALDAATGSGPVAVDFRIRKITKTAICNFLERAESIALPSGDAIMLEISDHGTTGLDGPSSMAETSDPAGFGKFIRLAYSMGLNQTTKGAGGSHGVGKSILYHTGAGLVIFHSLSGDKNRLVACWVEDQQKPGGYLRQIAGDAITTGVCWWGAGSRDGHPIPLEDPGRIQHILSCMGIGGRTTPDQGTTLAIPFLDLDRLDCRDMDDLQGKLVSAIKRWYFPRLENPDWTSSAVLIARVNGQAVMPDKSTEDNANTRLWQELWHAAWSGKGNDKIHVKPIETSGVEPRLGHLAWTIPDSPSCGWMDQIGECPQKLALVRKPGMVVRYHHADPWMAGLADGMPLHAIFVVDSQAWIHLKNPSRRLPVEEYFRSCESGNHHGWVHTQEAGGLHLGDRSNFTNRLRLAIRRLLDAETRPKIDGIINQTDLGMRFGRILIPEAFCQGGEKSLSTQATKGQAVTRPEIVIRKVVPGAGNVMVQAELDLPAAGKFLAGPRIDLGTSWMSMQDWLADSEGPFPMRCTSFEVESWRRKRTPGAPMRKKVSRDDKVFLSDREDLATLCLLPDGSGLAVETLGPATDGLTLSIVLNIDLSDMALRFGMHVSNGREA